MRPVQTATRVIAEITALISVVAIFVVPLVFVVLNAGMDVSQSSRMEMALPETPRYVENVTEVLQVADRIVYRAFFNSTVIATASVTGLVVVASMVGFVLERRKGRTMGLITFIVLAGLMVPPAVVPTIRVLQILGLFRTLPGMILIQIALNFPFATVLYRAYMVSVPREMDESAFIEGCNGFQLFRLIVFPLLKPVTATIIVLSGIQIFNDFVHPLYFLPGSRNATVQLTLYNFMSRYSTQWNLLFANVLLISIPPLVAFLIFNKRIVSGIVAGAIKS